MIDPKDIERLNVDKKKQIEQMTSEGRKTFGRAIVSLVFALGSYLAQVLAIMLLLNFVLPTEYELSYWKAMALSVAISLSTHNIFYTIINATKKDKK